MRLRKYIEKQVDFFIFEYEKAIIQIKNIKIKNEKINKLKEKIFSKFEYRK